MLGFEFFQSSFGSLHFNDARNNHVHHAIDTVTFFHFVDDRLGDQIDEFKLFFKIHWAEKCARFLQVRRK